MKSKGIVYIAGRITGDEHYKDKFRAAEKMLRARGYIVLNPARLPGGMTREDYMRICFTMIDVADEVYLLPDYTRSVGAQIEKQYTHYIGKPMKILEFEEEER